jgi:chromosome condensin MukBEF ATPase and DNA-binding subunit MukB
LHRLEKEHLEEIARTTVGHEKKQNEDTNIDALDDESNDGSVSVIHEQLWPAVLSFDENDIEMEDCISFAIVDGTIRYIFVKG